MRCPNCGMEVADTGKFCENCGAPISTADSAALAQQPTHDMAAGQTQPYAQSQGYEYETQPLDQMQTDPYGQAGQTDPFSYGQAQPDPHAYGQPYSQQDTQQYSSYGNQGTYQYDAQPGSYGVQPTTQMPPIGTAKQASNAPFVLAIIALVTALLGLFPVSLVLAIVALAMNSGQKKRGETSTKQTPTFVMGIISLIVSIIMALFTFVVGGIVVSEIAEHGTMPNIATEPPTTSPSPGASTDVQGSEDLVGTWEVESFDSGDVSYGAEYLDLMRDYGMKVELVMSEDGTASLDVLGESEVGTWADKGNGTVEFTFDDGRVDATLEGGKLMLVDDDNKIVFHRALADDEPESDSASAGEGA